MLPAAFAGSGPLATPPRRRRAGGALLAFVLAIPAVLLVDPPRLAAQRGSGRLTAEQTLLLILTPRGFTHKALTISEGKTALAVHNRTFFPALTFTLNRETSGERLQEGRVGGRKHAWRTIVELKAGEGDYVVGVLGQPDWIARITVRKASGGR